MILKKYFKSLIKQKKIKHNPYDDYHNIKYSPKSTGYFKPYERNKIIKYLEKHNKGLLLICELLYYCYIRPTEICKLKIENINTQQGTIYILGEISKNKKGLYVAIPHQLHSKLEKIEANNPSHYYLCGRGFVAGVKPTNYKSIYTANTKVLTHLNIQGRYTIYSWKHTYGRYCSCTSGHKHKRNKNTDETQQFRDDGGVPEKLGRARPDPNKKQIP